MAVRIRSLVSSGPLWVALSTGEHLRLAPGVTSDERPDVAVVNNESIAAMVRRGLIEVTKADAATGRPASRKAKSAGADTDISGGPAAPARGTTK